MKATFILPTNKPFNQYGGHVVNSILGLDHMGMESEILIFTDENISSEHEKIKIFDAKGHTNEFAHQGAVYGYNFLCKQASGDYIVLAADDQAFSGPIFNSINVIENEFSDRRFKLLTIPCRDKCHLNDDPNIGYLPRYVMARFPIVSRQTLDGELNGCLFNPKFRHHYADSWLGYFLGINNEMAEERLDCGGMSPFGPNGVFNYDDYDKQVFLQLIEDYQNGYHQYV